MASTFKLFARRKHGIWSLRPFHAALQLCVATACFGVVFAFDAEEHKLAGDLGSSAVCQKLASMGNAAADAVPFIKCFDGQGTASAGDEPRVINTESLKGLLKRGIAEKSAFYPRGADGSLTGGSLATNAAHPLLLWVGKAADRVMPAETARGGFFTFGDLVAMYGDLWRSMTCSEGKTEQCGLMVDASHFDSARRAALHDFAAGWAVHSKDLVVQDAVSISDHKVHYTAGGKLKSPAEKPSVNHDVDFTAQVVDLALANKNHFSGTALHTYLGLHRQALELARAAAVHRAGGRAAAADAQWWVALHHEAHACHMLTDLFAPGHMVVEREAVANGVFAANAASEPVKQVASWQAAVASRKSSLRGAALTPLPHPQLLDDAHAMSSGAKLKGLGLIDKFGLHDQFNHGGATVVNLRQLSPGGHAAGPWSRPHRIAAAADGSWRATGDGTMSEYQDKSATARSNPGHAEWVGAAVEDSLAALVTAYERLIALQSEAAITAEAAAIASSPAFYEALADVPIKARNLVRSGKITSETYAPQGTRWVAYAGDILEALGFSRDSQGGPGGSRLSWPQNVHPSTEQQSRAHVDKPDALPMCAAPLGCDMSPDSVDSTAGLKLAVATRALSQQLSGVGDQLMSAVDDAFASVLGTVVSPTRPSAAVDSSAAQAAAGKAQEVAEAAMAIARQNVAAAAQATGSQGQGQGQRFVDADELAASLDLAAEAGQRHSSASESRSRDAVAAWHQMRIIRPADGEGDAAGRGTAVSAGASSHQQLVGAKAMHRHGKRGADQRALKA